MIETIFGFLGPDGTGKTATLRVLAVAALTALGLAWSTRPFARSLK